MKFATTLRLAALVAHAAAARQTASAPHRSKDKDETIQAFNQAAEKEAYIQQQLSGECMWPKQETCYDDEWNPYCAEIADGGCPCPTGEERCGADEVGGYLGYCTNVCCDFETEEKCYGYPDSDFCAEIKEGGCPCPTGEERCGADEDSGYLGYCTDVCCDDETQEKCYSYPDNYCAEKKDGGCPCPDGTDRCGADEEAGYLGYCTSACCDYETQEFCYSYPDNYCAEIKDGGCPCPDGEERCGADEDSGYLGHCTDVCCDYETQERCYGYPDSDYCAEKEDGGCPCPDGQERCGAEEDHGYLGWCTDVCCDDETQEKCHVSFGEDYCAEKEDGGCPCPEGTERCGADPSWGYLGYCTDICCDDETQEYCFDDAYNPYCAENIDGGCPCREGQERCQADEEVGYLGYCTDLCCDEETQETCYDDQYNKYCAEKNEGGCPCPEGLERCGSDEDTGFLGYCVDECCDEVTQETCLDENFHQFCAEINDGGCQKTCPEGQEACLIDDEYSNLDVHLCLDQCCDSYDPEDICFDKDDRLICNNDDKQCPTQARYNMQQNHASTLIQAIGTQDEIFYYQKTKAQQMNLMDADKGTKMALMQKEVELFRKIKVRMAGTSSKNEAFDGNAGNTKMKANMFFNTN